MEPLAKLGEASARLRNLYGLSLEECASRIEVPVERLAAMERGEIESGDLERARGMVARAREHFGTPWEITTRHLENLGFIEERIAETLRDDTPRPPALLHPTSLSATGRMTLLFALAGISDEAATPQDPLRHVHAARQAAEAAIDALNADVIAKASEAVEHKRAVEAVHLLIGHFDDLFHAGEFAAARRALAMLDPHRFPRRVLPGVLMVTRHARDQLGSARGDFLARVQAALADTWLLPPEDIAAITRRFA